MRDARKTVLVVDDEAANRTLLTEILASNGWSIITADSGHQALACVAENPPDLILLDIMMPGMNGFEVLRRLRGDAATADIPVMMLTALDDREIMAQAMDAGADDVLTKPVNRETFLSRVKNLLRLPGAGNEESCPAGGQNGTKNGAKS